MRHLVTTGLGLALLIVLPSTALSGVDREVDAAAKVRGTLAPVGDVDVFRFQATRGALMALAIKAKGKSDLDFDLTLTAPGDVDVALTSAPVFQDAGKKVKVKKLVLPGTGRYTLRVGGTGTGEYSLSVKVLPQKTWTDTVSLGGNGTAFLPFAAPTGAKLIVTAKQAAGSAAMPRLAVVQPEKVASAEPLKIPVLDEGGDLEVEVSNDSPAAGDVVVTVKVAQKLKPEKVDVRGKSLASPDGGETSVSATVGAVQGGEVGVADPQSAIDGAGVAVAPGALAVDTRITINSTSQIAVPDEQTQQPAGPAVEFGPEGLAFSSPADVTVPFDPNAIPAGQDPEDVISVQKIDADGNTQTSGPGDVDVDVDGGTVTVPASSFSKFMAFVPRGSPRLSGRSYWFAFLEAEIIPDFQNADSRRRELFQGAGTAVFGDEGPQGGLFLDINERMLSLSHDDNGDRIVTTDTFAEGELATWTYNPDGQSVELTFPAEEGDTADAFVAEDGSALLLNFDEQGFDPVASLGVMIERRATGLTHASLAGTWFIGGLEIDVADQAFGGPAPIEFTRVFGTLSLRANGTFAADVQVGDQFFDPPTGSFQTDGERERSNGAITIIDEFADDPFPVSILLQTNDPEDAGLRMLPNAKGDVMIGFPEALDEFGDLYFAVRAGSDVRLSDIAGAYGGTTLLFEDFSTYDIFGQGPPVTVGDFGLASLTEIRSFDGAGTLTFIDTLEHIVHRDPLNTRDGGVHSMTQTFVEPPERYTVKRNGVFEIAFDDGSLIGAFTPDQIFSFALEDPQSANGLPGFDVSIRLPPKIVPPAK